MCGVSAVVRVSGPETGKLYPGGDPRDTFGRSGFSFLQMPRTNGLLFTSGVCRCRAGRYGNTSNKEAGSFGESSGVKGVLFDYRTYTGGVGLLGVSMDPIIS